MIDALIIIIFREALTIGSYLLILSIIVVVLLLFSLNWTPS